MNVFVLCTGRCGSVTFVESCKHITNFTAGHETRCHWTGDKRFAYPPHHIEADNRLSWLLGRLDRAYGDDAFYVHLTRDREATARSYARRYPAGISGAYRKDILMRSSWKNNQDSVLDICRDYCDTVDENIRHFLRGKSRHAAMTMEGAKAELPVLWAKIGAIGDLARAQEEWDVKHNSSEK